MKVSHTQPIGFFDIDYEKHLQLAAAARFCQDMATRHAAGLGIGANVLFSRGFTWLLHRLELDFCRYPVLGEEITITTWSRGFKHHQGYREYTISSDRGPVARGTSVWIFFDFVNKRIRKVPPDVSGHYTFEPEAVLETELREWRPCGRIEPEQETAISLRYGDFDQHFHVNNTVYLGFVETLFHTVPELSGKRIGNVKIRFCREIGRDTAGVVAAAARQDGRYLFNIRRQGGQGEDGTVYADGEFSPMD